MSRKPRRRSGGDASEEALDTLIINYQRAYVRFLDTADSNTDLVSDGEAFDLLEKTAYALLEFPCKTLCAVRRKAGFFLSTPALYTVLLEDDGEGSGPLRIFLTSIIEDRGS